MARWKLFGRSKSKEDEEPEYREVQEEVTPQESEEIIQPETEQEPEKPTLPEYHETLYTEGSTPKKDKEKISRTSWRDVRAIEEDVDKLHINRAKKPVTELDKKIDRLTSQIEVEESETHRKPSNVIYVVNRPQPGQVRGDWAVRGHGKIYSQHRTKEKAINAARKIAKERNATVMVQNTDGTFSEGFKPRQ